ncbi:MAG: hypothetical protein RR404_04365 [Bacilli bacterium]
MSIEKFIKETKFIGNYAIVKFKVIEKNKNGKAKMVIGVIDKSNKDVIPITQEIESNNLKRDITYYNYEKVIYKYDDNFYLLDLNKVSFKDENIPDNYELTFKDYVKLSDNTIAICNNNDVCFVYDVKKGQQTSLNFNYIKTSADKVEGYFLFYNDYTLPVVVTCNLNKKGEIIGEVSITTDDNHDDIIVYFSDEIKNEVKKMEDNCTKLFIEYFNLLQKKAATENRVKNERIFLKKKFNKSIFS